MALRFRQLQALHAIVETGTVTAAAEALKISQPGVSNLISQMERSMKIPLFGRQKGRLTPTPEAMILYHDIDTVVRAMEHVNQTVHDLQNKQIGQLQVVTTHSISFGLMPELIAGFCRSRPQVSVSFQSQYSAKIQEWITAGLFEIGVCELPLFSDAFHADLFSLNMICALPNGHDLAERKTISPRDLADEDLIVMAPEHMTHRRMREVFQDEGIRWQPKVHTHLFNNMLGLVREGVGVALVDPFTLAKGGSKGVITKVFEPTIRLDMAVIRSKRHTLSTLGEAFYESLLSEIREFAAMPERQG